MSDWRIEFDGLTELKAALMALPAALGGEAAHIVEGAGNQAVLQIKTAYPVRSGNLRDGVEQTLVRSEFGASVKVVNKSKHAYIFENGSQARHYVTTGGATHQTGVMPPSPPGHAFIPVMVRERQAMNQKLKDMLVRNGLLVSGDE